MGDQLLIRLCSPTLAGLKTGNLFTVDIDDREQFNKEVREFNSRFLSKGIRMIPVKYSKGHVLIYLYRPSYLKRDFRSDEVCRILKEKGYSYSNADLCVAQLARHLAKDGTFPHEIGLFLGYPVEDVVGFMRSPEEGVKYTGFWKVYGDMDSALKTFDRYKKCTEIYSRAHKHGISLDKLTVAS
ncbi:DUF3793 family protein [Butyrivibrio sp. INlla16]|uniref:DUF3793 family protein n=1 Tax=Butyrivibrio sp. INlla16 TaxID=1520807 RepID=UPI0008874CF2|nr:DUF3793 family protein [Butyrivibrio sp. INlla16]SDB58490.1 Protein of unknown function [Butyrivibrio sp. INlla16]